MGGVGFGFLLSRQYLCDEDSMIEMKIILIFLYNIKFAVQFCCKTDFLQRGKKKDQFSLINGISFFYETDMNIGFL